jgi:hypothetical protein
MATTFAARRNHYQTLGVEPKASQEDIARAFAARMFVPHAMADAAQVGMAYEVLRNPDKRKAYDEALGIGRPRVAPAAVSFRISARVIGAPAEPQVETETRRATSERAVGSFIAQSLRPPAAPAPEPRPEPEAQAPRASTLEITGLPRTEPPARSFVAPAALPDDEAGESGWNRTALAAGAAVLAVVVIGGWAGLEAGTPSDALPEQAAVSTALPKAKPAAAAPADAVLEPSAESAAPVAFAGLRTRHSRNAAKPAPSPDRLADVSQSLHKYYETTGPDGTPEIAVADAPAAAPATETAAPAEVTPASMPLPDSVVARTIKRIGYACGSVASTSAVEGSPGVFKVTCTSGHSYQATPVRGRYHFRRVSN